MSWLDDLGDMVHRADERDAQAEAEDQARRQRLAAAFEENRKHLDEVVRPVLEAAAQKLGSSGRTARVVNPGTTDGALGEVVKQSLVLPASSSTARDHSLDFSASKNSETIQVGSDVATRETVSRVELDAEAVQRRVIEFVKNAFEASW